MPSLALRPPAREGLTLPHTQHGLWRELLTGLGYTTGGGLSLAALYLAAKKAAEGAARLAGWMARRRERATAESSAHEANAVAQHRIESEEDREARRLLEDKARRLDTGAFTLIERLQDQVNAQDERLKQLEEKVAFSELTAQAAHLRADESDKRYLAAKIELDTLRADNAALTAQIERAAADKTDLLRQVRDNLERIEALEAELRHHRAAAHAAAKITLDDGD